LNPRQQVFKKVLGPFNGLTTLSSPDGSKVLVTLVENQQLITRIITVAQGTVQNLPFTTYPEKCVWANNDQLYCGVPLSIPVAQHPDDWYKGLFGFADNLWGFTPSSGRSLQISAFPESIDVMRMQYDRTHEYLFFMNKNTYELWSYRIGGSE
jgi:hypothetical protein